MIRHTNHANIPSVGSEAATSDLREGWHNVPPSPSPDRGQGVAVPDRKDGSGNVPPVEQKQPSSA